TAAFTAGTPPFYGQSYFKRPSGRASDGRILIDFIASSLGKPFLHPYLDSLGANFSYGVNFAQLLATIAPPKLILPVAQQPRAYS
ncbi:hypothetical protein, partial [Klebsiella pneumoniae]|uniref:hypothetical protein n=1 Tax=Klebsiella pneumoniae TaxID=573 RepID=UPI00301402D3